VNPLQLERPRDITALFRDGLGVYVRNLPVFLAVGAGIVIPVQLIVSGVGLEQLTSGYDPSPSAAQTAIPTVVSFFVVAPLVTATCIHILRALETAGTPKARAALLAGFEAFTPLFLAIVLQVAGIVIGLAALIVPGVYLTIRWFFVPQTVVVEGKRGRSALARSGQLVQGFWWRACGIVIMANLAAALPGLVLTAPFAGIADAADRQVFALIGSMAAEAVTAPIVAILSTLLYFDLRARRAAPAAPGL
jgi:hypothetical protein